MKPREPIIARVRRHCLTHDTRFGITGILGEVNADKLQDQVTVRQVKEALATLVRRGWLRPAGNSSYEWVR